jgi:hypothetical protein
MHAAIRAIAASNGEASISPSALVAVSEAGALYRVANVALLCRFLLHVLVLAHCGLEDVWALRSLLQTARSSGSCRILLCCRCCSC